MKAKVVKCPVCKGYTTVGYYPDNKPCNACGAKGYLTIPENKTAVKCPVCYGYGVRKKDHSICSLCKGDGYITIDSCEMNK